MVNYRKQKKKGFTLTELLIVLLILGILVGLGVPKYMPAADTARINTFASNLAQLARDIENSSMIAQGVYGAEISSPTTLKELLGKVDYTQNPLNPFTKANMLDTVLYPVDGTVQESEKNKETGIDVWTNDAGGIVFVVTQKDAKGNNIYDKYFTQMPHGCAITSYMALGISESEPIVNKQAKVQEHMQECKDSGIFTGNPQGMGLCPATIKWGDIQSHHGLNNLQPNTATQLTSYGTVYYSVFGGMYNLIDLIYIDKNNNLQSCIYGGYYSGSNDDEFTLQTSLRDKWMFNLEHENLPGIASVVNTNRDMLVSLLDENGRNYIYRYRGYGQNNNYQLLKILENNTYFAKVYSVIEFNNKMFITGARVNVDTGQEEFGTWLYDNSKNDNNLGIPVTFDASNYGGGIPIPDGTFFFCFPGMSGKHPGMSCGSQFKNGEKVLLIQTFNADGWVPSWDNGQLTSLPSPIFEGYSNSNNYSHFYTTDADGYIHFHNIPSLSGSDWLFGAWFHYPSLNVSAFYTPCYSYSDNKYYTFYSNSVAGPFILVTDLTDIEYRSMNFDTNTRIFSLDGVNTANNNQPVTCTSSDGINWTCTPQ